MCVSLVRGTTSGTRSRTCVEIVYKQVARVDLFSFAIGGRPRLGATDWLTDSLTLAAIAWLALTAG